MADHPLRPATDHRLGRPLPHQLTNQTQAHLTAKALIELPFPKKPLRLPSLYPVLARLSSGYPNCKVDYLRVTHPYATLLRIAPVHVRLACVRHAASVRSEP